jgi:hypothetical protein
MEKRPVKRTPLNVEEDNGRKEMEVQGPLERANPFISFRYSFREISSVDGRTHIRATERSFENGKFKSEDFEGTLAGHVYGDMIGRMQRLLFSQMELWMRPFSMFLPGGPKDKDR